MSDWDASSEPNKSSSQASVSDGDQTASDHNSDKSEDDG